MKHFIIVFSSDVLSFPYGSLDESVLNIHIVKGLRHFFWKVYTMLCNALQYKELHISHRIKTYTE
jgi:hypothetical protein